MQHTVSLERRQAFIRKHNIGNESVLISSYQHIHKAVLVQYLLKYVDEGDLNVICGIYVFFLTYSANNSGSLHKKNLCILVVVTHIIMALCHTTQHSPQHTALNNKIQPLDLVTIV